MNRDSQIISLYRHGKGLKAIAKEIGTNHMRIKRTLIRLGVYHNPHQEPGVTVTAQGNNEVTEVTSDNQLSKPSDNQTALKQYQKALCKNSDTCSVCQLEPDNLKLLEELYIAGTPSPVLHNYFDIPSKDLGYHAYYLNWHKKRLQMEDPRRKKAIQEALETEVWQTIMASETGGDAGDRISAMKLAAQIQGIMGDSEGKGQGQGVGPGVVVNMRFSLNSQDQEQALGEVLDVGEKKKE